MKVTKVTKVTQNKRQSVSQNSVKQKGQVSAADMTGHFLLKAVILAGESHQGSRVSGIAGYPGKGALLDVSSNLLENQGGIWTYPFDDPDDDDDDDDDFTGGLVKFNPEFTLAVDIAGESVGLPGDYSLNYPGGDTLLPCPDKRGKLRMGCCVININ